MRVQEGELKVDFEVQVVEERCRKLRERKPHGKFFNDIKNIAHEKSWQCTRGEFFHKCTEEFVCSAQENIVPTCFYCTAVIKDSG